ncbi:MAG: inorganic phosphate transporter [candidate division NC10 bacterium]
MSEPGWIIILVVVLAVVFDFTNGWNDAANAIATVVSTRVLTPIQAVVLAGVLNVAGAFYSTAVAKTIGTGIVDPTLITQLTVAAALIGGIAWNGWMTLIGMPISASHALIGAIMGASIAHGGVGILNFQGLKPIFAAMVLSPALGIVLGLLFMVGLSWLFFRTSPAWANPLFRKLQVVSVSFMAFAHGTGDAQKVMGVITLALVSGGYLSSVEVPWWVILIAALAMGLGTVVGGWKVVKTLGLKMLKMQPVHGFAAETTAAMIVIGASDMGVPVSTTHTITTSIMGVGAAQRLSAVRWGLSLKILYAWLFTLPGAGLVAYVAYHAIHFGTAWAR